MKDSNMPMPNRERFLAICHGERPGDVMNIDWFNRCWVDTPKEWVKQGAPKEILKPDRLMLITREEEETLGDGYEGITVTPLWKWLLQEES